MTAPIKILITSTIVDSDVRTKPHLYLLCHIMSFGRTRYSVQIHVVWHFLCILFPMYSNVRGTFDVYDLKWPQIWSKGDFARESLSPDINLKYLDDNYHWIKYVVENPVVTGILMFCSVRKLFSTKLICKGQNLRLSHVYTQLAQKFYVINSRSIEYQTGRPTWCHFFFCHSLPHCCCTWLPSFWVWHRAPGRTPVVHRLLTSSSPLSTKQHT